MAENHATLIDQSQAIRTVIVHIKNKKMLNIGELELFKNHLRLFNATLLKKISASENDTKELFDHFKVTTAEILRYPDAAIQPDEKRYNKIGSIIHDISMNPVTALAFEESLRTSSTPIATIQPEKGPGATYWEGEQLRFAVTVNRDCFVQIFFVIRQENEYNATLQPLIFYPEPGKTSLFLKEGDSLILGEDGSFKIKPPFGSDVILVVASDKPLPSNTSSESYPFAFPFEPEKLLAEIYDDKRVDKLSLHSCFIVSKPKETD